MPVDTTVPAGNTGNLLMNMIYGQQNDPAQRMADWTRTNQARNRTAIGLDLSGNLLPAPQPGSAPGVGSGQITGPPQDPTAAMATLQQTGTLSPSQTPNAYKSDETMGSLIISLQRRQEAAAGLQQSLGLAGAAISRPENRERAFKTFAPGPQGNPVELGQALMNLSSQTQGQDRMNAIGQMINDPQRGPALAKSLNNMSWEDLKAAFQANPANVGQMVQNFLAPTPDLQNLQGLQRMGAGGAGASPTLNDTAAAIMGKLGGQQAMDMAQAGWRAKHPGRPDSEMDWKVNDPASFAQYTANEQQNEADRKTASNELVDKNEATLTLKGDLEELKNSPGLKSILTTPGKRPIADLALNDKGVFDVATILAKYAGLSNEEAAAIALLKRIGGATTETAMKGMAGTGTRVTQLEVGPLKDAITMTQNLNQSYEDYIHGAINNAITKSKRAVAANYGTTGNVTNMDPEYAPWLNSAFKKHGQLYKEGSGADALPDFQPVPNQEVTDAKELLAKKPYLKNELLDTWQQRGLDTSKFRTKNPSQW